MAIRLSLLLSFLILSGCGSDSRNSSPVFVKGQIKSGMPQEYEEKIGIISGLERHELFLDTDKDGILDRDDFDIDNDQVPNDCDKAPFDGSIGREDFDQDEIPDFCDLSDPSELQRLQEETFSHYGIILNLNEKFEDFDPEGLRKALSHISTRTIMPNKMLVTITLTTNLPHGESGLYDEAWRHVRLRPDSSSHDEFSDIALSSWTLVHELFHFVGETNSRLFSEFEKWFQGEHLTGRLTYPTEYSKLSKEEYFAEMMTSQYFNIKTKR